MTVPSFGIVTHAVGHEQMPFDTCVQLCKEAGAQHILLLSNPDAAPVLPGQDAPSHYPNALESEPAELRRVVADAGLGIGGLLPFIRPFVANDDEVAASLAQLIPWVGAAAAIGTHNLVLSSPPPPFDGATHEDKKPYLERTAALLDALVEASDDPEFAVTVDIHRGTLVQTVEDAQYLVSKTRQTRAGLLLNIGHLTTCGEEGWRLVEENGDKIFTVGWKDHSLAEDRPNPVYSIELGTGESPFEKYIHAFKGSMPRTSRTSSMWSIRHLVKRFPCSSAAMHTCASFGSKPTSFTQRSFHEKGNRHPCVLGERRLPGERVVPLRTR